jgi:outer membrane receptor for ferrienterochelin and colicins
MFPPSGDTKGFLCLSHSLAGLLALLFILAVPSAAQTNSDEDVTSLDSLLNISVSTAAKYDQKMSEAAASVTVIRSEEIEKYGYRTLAEVIESVRGFYLNDDRNYTYVGSRGFGRPTDYNDRILFLINGHTYNENCYGGTSNGGDFGMDLAWIDRIEIVRGPGSSLYGSMAMFGVVNIITKRGSSVNGLRVSAEAGSFGRYQGAAQYGREIGVGKSLYVGGFATAIKGQDYYFPEFDVPETNNGIARGMDREFCAGGLAAVSLRDISVYAMMNYRTKDIPTAPWGIPFSLSGARSLDMREYLEVQYAPQLTPSVSFAGRAYVDGYHYRGWYPYDVMYGDENFGQWQGGEAQFVVDLGSSNRLVFGGEYVDNSRATYTDWNNAEVFTDGNYPYTVVSGYVQDDHQFTEDINAVVGMRIDKLTGQKTFFSPRGALVVTPFSGTTLKLLYGGSFRAPNIYESAVEDLAANQKKSNPGLKPEIISTAELVWEQRLSPSFWGVLSVYNYRMRDLIDPIDQPLDPENPTGDYFTYYQNVGRVKASGGECELRASFPGGLRGYASYGLTGAKDAGTGAWLSNSPEHLAKLGASASVSTGLLLSMSLYYESGRKSLRGSSTSAFLLAHAGILFRPVESMKLQLMVRNIFDTRYSFPAGEEHVQQAIQQNGRDVSFRIEYAPF